MFRRSSSVALVVWLCAVAVLADDDPLVVELWPASVPDEPRDLGPEVSRMSPALDRKRVEVTEPTRMVTNVSRPTITICRPPKDHDTGTAMLICPGGGYWDLYWQLEGEEVAAWLNTLGVTGVILKYRVPRRPDEPQGLPARRPLQDAQRAVSLVRCKAEEWGINPQRIGIMAFRLVATWPLRLRRASKSGRTHRSMRWTKSVVGPISPFSHIRVISRRRTKMNWPRAFMCRPGHLPCS